MKKKFFLIINCSRTLDFKCGTARKIASAPSVIGFSAIDICVSVVTEVKSLIVVCKLATSFPWNKNSERQVLSVENEARKEILRSTL